VTLVVATSIYTFIALVSDARISSMPSASYGERYAASLRGWSSSLGFLGLGDFIGVSAAYQVHGHLVDWELAPLLIGWPGVLIELLTALITPRIRIPWMALGIVLFALGVMHGATSPVTAP
jgi:hypothetical protein